VIPVTAALADAASSSAMEIDTLLRGQQLEREGRLDDAAEAYREGLRKEPGHVAVRVRLGLVLRHMGRDEEANDVFREVLELHPAEIDAD
jgi:Flp pilus assembly protein TadD